MRAVVLQSNYLPWKGYFDLIASADVFVVYDSVQYTKNDWRNRNRLMTKNGPIWLTLPVITAGRFGQSIKDAEISDASALSRHWKTIVQTYGNLEGFSDVAGELSDTFNALSAATKLHDVNVGLLRTVLRLLSIGTEILDDSVFSYSADDPTARLVQICAELGANSYLTGPAGLNYLDIEQFQSRAIAVEVIEYQHYSTYSQFGSGEFEHSVSVIDLLAHQGVDGARTEMRGRTHEV
jgi:hypothetical protein